MEANCVKCCQAKKFVRKAKNPVACRFHEFPNEDIERLLENAVPATTTKSNKGWNELMQ